MTWFWLSLLAMFLFVIYNLLGRILSVNSQNPRAFSVLYNALTAGLSLLLFLFEPFKFSSIPLPIILLTLVGLLVWGIFARFEFAAKKYVEVSILQVVTRLAPVVTFLLAAIFLGEKITLPKLVSLMLIGLANMIVISNKISLHLNRGLVYAIIMATCLGAGWTFDKVVSSYYALPFYSVLTFGVPSLLNWLTPPLKLKTLSNEWHLATWKILLLGLINVLGYYLILKAYTYGEASKITLIVSSSGIVTIAAGIIILKERTQVFRKLTAAFLILISLFLLQ